MSSREESCEARIADHMRSREEYAAALFAAIDNGGGVNPDDPEGDELTDDDAYEAVNELPLGVSTYKVVRIDLSTGGPGDWLEVKLEGSDVERVDYHFNDWFDHAERSVSTDEALWRLAEYFAEGL